MVDGGGACLMRASVNRNSVDDVDFERLRLVGCLPNPLTYARFHTAVGRQISLLGPFGNKVIISSKGTISLFLETNKSVQEL